MTDLDTLGASSPHRLIEPWNERKARKAAAARASIEREVGKLRETYMRAGLPLPPSLVMSELPPVINAPTPKKLGGKGRNPKATAARLAAISAGQNIYQGNPCPRGHNGLRYVRGCDCVECSKGRNLKRRVRGVWRSVEIADTARTATGFRCVVCRKPFAPKGHGRREPLYCSSRCNYFARGQRKRAKRRAAA